MYISGDSCKSQEYINETYTDSGYLVENSSTVIDIPLDIGSGYRLINMTFTLEWEDEPDYDNRHSNKPDHFMFIVNTTTEEIESELASHGKIILVYNPPNPEAYEHNHDWKVEVVCVECGDQIPFSSDPLGLRNVTDEGNNWDITAKWTMQYIETDEDEKNYNDEKDEYEIKFFDVIIMVIALFVLLILIIILLRIKKEKSQIR
jgi:hypothetical protein